MILSKKIIVPLSKPFILVCVKPREFRCGSEKGAYPDTQTEAYLKIRLLQFGKTYDEKYLLGNTNDL